jgi:hypothetical protein
MYITISHETLSRISPLKFAEKNKTVNPRLTKTTAKSTVYFEGQIR